MPTYEYQCTKCGKVFEQFQSITAKPLKRMPADSDVCSCKAPVQRLIGSGAGVLFKGSGFYETDYRSDSYKKAAKAETESSSGKDTSKDGAKDGKKSTETSTATKSETSTTTKPKSGSKKTSSGD